MKRNKSEKKLNNLNIILWRKISILALGIISVFSVIAILVSYFAFYNQASGKVERVGQEVESYVFREYSDDTQKIENYFITLEKRENVFIYLVSSDGERVIQGKGEIAEDPENDDVVSRDWKEFVNEIKSKYNKTNDTVLIYSDSQSINYVSIVTLYQPFYILVEYRSDVIVNALGSISLNAFLLAIVSMIFTFIISYNMSQKISLPLKNITKMANRMARGENNVKFIAVEYSEVAELADSLNYANEEIGKVERFRQELLANVSHDFKTPLTMIKAYASMIQEISGDNPEKRNKHLQVIIDEADRLTKLVNEVLSVSKLNSDIETINKKVFNLTDFLYGVIDKFEFLQETQGYSFMIDIDADLYTCADEEKIGQAVYNLISNAVNYTGEDKKVYISLKQDYATNRIKLKIRDTGNGIKEEDLPNIWDRYYRIKELHVRGINGTGLGLNIVKTILQRHSFDFGVESTLGDGSVFWIDFPLIKNEIDI